MRGGVVMTIGGVPGTRESRASFWFVRICLSLANRASLFAEKSITSFGYSSKRTSATSSLGPNPAAMLSRLFWTFSDSLVGRSSSRITTAEIGKGSFQKKRMGCSTLSWKMRKSSCCRSATRFPLGSFTVTGTSTSVVWTIILAGVCAGFAAGFCGEAALWEAVDCEAVPLWPAEEIEQTGNSTAAAKIVRNFLIFPLPPLHIARGEDITATCQVIAAAGRIRLRGGCIELSAMKNSYRLY